MSGRSLGQGRREAVSRAVLGAGPAARRHSACCFSVHSALSLVALLRDHSSVVPCAPAKRLQVSWRLISSGTWLSQGRDGALRALSHLLWLEYVYTHPCTHPCTPLKIPNSSPSSQCPVLRLGPRDCPLHPVPWGEFAEGSLGLEHTVFTWGDVAALPVDGPGPPGAQVLRHHLVGVGVHTLHTPGLEAVVAAGRCAQGPQADPPVYAAGF